MRIPAWLFARLFPSVVHKGCALVVKAGTWLTFPALSKSLGLAVFQFWHST